MTSNSGFREWLNHMAARRTVRDFAPEPIQNEIIEIAYWRRVEHQVAPNLQPWHFACVTSQALRKEIRIAAEQDEREFYQHRAPQAWLDALGPFRNRRQQAFSRDCSAVDRHFRPGAWGAARWIRRSSTIMRLNRWGSLAVC